MYKQINCEVTYIISDIHVYIREYFVKVIDIYSLVTKITKIPLMILLKLNLSY